MSAVGKSNEREKTYAIEETERFSDESSLDPFSLQIGFIVIVLIMIYISYRVARSFAAFDLDEYKAGTDLSATYIEPGLNVDNLPNVTLNLDDYRPSQATGDDDTTTNDSEQALRRVTCLQRGVYLGTENRYVNCANYCHVSSEQEVMYTFVTDASRYVTGRLHLTPGAWCLPTRAASCNPNTSLVVYSLNGWMCLPRTDLFGGEGGNRILACNGSIRDNATNQTYNLYIPANLTFNDFYEDKLPDGRYRFECPPDLRDEYQNKYLRSPFDRFHLIHNFCVRDIPFADDKIVPDFTTGKCNCGDNLHEMKNGECSACKEGFNVDTFTFNLQQMPCYSLRDTVQFLERIRDRVGESGVVLPCGFTQQTNAANENVQPRCIEDRLSAFAPLLPSASTLTNIQDKLLRSVAI